MLCPLLECTFGPPSQKEIRNLEKSNENKVGIDSFIRNDKANGVSSGWGRMCVLVCVCLYGMVVVMFLWCFIKSLIKEDGGCTGINCPELLLKLCHQLTDCRYKANYIFP